MKKQLLLLASILSISYLSLQAYKLYLRESEIHDFTYTALVSYIEKNELPNLREKLSDALADDGVITRNEFTPILQYISQMQGMYTGPSMNTDHSNSKKELIELLAQ
ncbi:hypothetical protein [Moritella sp. F3]|uniref:hypothetical protein n=1 Tax=Moritella sp. F3 TaxID=2718882 RepID=UPI0018E1A793|nr:hypothetical protein [Moritella sp. F3]GIC77109.1 hypothetical protein FMO001_18360 [Moritella sp. F1]GIC82228.1 hypothetical protein FMO003_25090 [Moritella sp. F3]